MSVRDQTPSRERGLTQRGALNATARALEYGARVAVAFILNPLLVSGLGNFGFGAWQVLRRLVGFAGPATGRPGHALRWTLASRQASSDYDEKRSFVGSAATVWLIFLPIIMGLGGMFAWFAPMWLKAPVPLVWPVRLTAVFLVVDVVTRSLVELPRSTLEGENLGYKRMGWSAGFVLLGGVLVALALFLELGLVGVAAATVATSIVTGFFFLHVARSWVPWFGMRRPARGAVKRFLNLSGWFLAWNGVLTLTRASDVVILGMFASVELVTDYTLLRYLPEALTSLVAMVVFGVMPGLGGIIGAGDKSKAIRIRREIMTYSWLLLTVGGATIALWNQSFVTLWVGAEFSAGPTETLLIVLLVVQFALMRNDANIIDLTLDLRAKVLIAVASVTISIVLAWFFVTSLDGGIIGLCVGFMVGRSVLSIAYPWLVGRHLGIRIVRQFRGLIRPAVVTIALFSPIAWLSHFVAASGWFQLVGSIGVTFLLTSGVAFYGGIDRASRQQLIKRVQLVAAGTGGKGRRVQ